ncbi:hypothetical protein LTR36_004506 [Oleoguttula mirabilis]|uniref:2-haloalkanoic acid dehalogenase n=1 Tax=Oleoguttula mirabilis TaxID=1507867 RepID=A0AAV9JH66_9PEZI|nr:hypothetical protein LTR36_004506 [Oleoguttula mirabilis]
MASTGKHVVFDIVGTCVSYDVFYEAIEERMGDRLRSQGIKPQLFGYAWMEAGERECSYLDRSGRYVQFWKIFKPLFYRTLWMAGVQEPRDFATDDDAEFVVASYRRLKARPGIHECMSLLREAGFTIWALTSGDAERVQGYLSSNGIELASENFVTCDSIGVSKPAPEVYKHVLDKFAGAEQTWFAAAHMWDASAAKHYGFKAAWCSVWEKEPAPEVFGDIDILADDLPTMAKGIIAACQ